MKIIFFVILFFHGLIHLLGFAKAFNLKEIKELTLPISQFSGIIWLISALLFITSGILFAFENKSWWLPAFIAVLISQILVFYFWKDAKIGTIPNLIILLTAIIGYSNYNFQKMVSLEIENLISNVDFSLNTIIDANDILKLPFAVQNWLNTSGVIGKPNINSVFLKQKAFMKMKPDQTDWYEAEAIQYFNINHSSFIWSVKMQMMTLIKVLGRDKLLDGKGEMLVKLFGLIPLVDTKNNEKLNTGSLQRYLAEIVWFPSAALSNNIRWEAIDDSTASATINVNGTFADGIFYFNKDGSFKKFSTMRYFGGEDDSKLNEWIISSNEINEINGIKIPTKSTATWNLESGKWDWLKIEISEITYNFK